MSERNEIKPDTILKNFWKDNERFADLFNAVVFDGEQVLQPSDLVEADTDVSSVLKFNGHAETVQKIMDVVKKTANGVDFVILGLENQNKIHYGMPLRHMIGDGFSYLKEYNEIAKRNKNEKELNSSDEFLSGFKKTDRLHPMISLCVYYGEKEWDGATCLKDMLVIPKQLEAYVSDYKMNLLQIRESGKYHFKNAEVRTIFDLSRLIYEGKYDNIIDIYKEIELQPELGMVVGAITESKPLIDYAVKSEEKGGQFNMCEALTKWLEENAEQARTEGRLEGKLEGEKVGMKKILMEMVEKKLAKNKTPEEIAEDLEEDISVIYEIIEELKK